MLGLCRECAALSKPITDQIIQLPKVTMFLPSISCWVATQHALEKFLSVACVCPPHHINYKKKDPGLMTTGKGSM